MTVHHVKAKAVGIIVFLIVGAVLFAALFKGAGGRLRLSTPYTVSVVMPDAFQLVNNADVRRAGVTIGRVADVTNRGSNALVKLELEDDHAPVYENARSLLRTKTIVGENYVELDPGTPDAGRVPDGGTIPISHSGEPVQLDEILSSLDRPTRESIQRNLDGLGTALENRSADVNTIFARLRPSSEHGEAVLSLVADQRHQFADLIDHTGRLTQAIGAQRSQLRSLVVSAKQTAEAVASRDRALARTLEEFPGALRWARTTVGRLQRFSANASPVVGDLTTGLRDLGPVLTTLPASAEHTRNTFRQLAPFLRVANPLLRRLRSFSEAMTPTVPALDELLQEVQPTVTYLGPYHRELGAYLANEAGMGAYRDKIGGALRILNFIDHNSLAAHTPQTRKAIDELERTMNLFINGPELKENPYPKPGTNATPQPFDGDYPVIRARPPMAR